MSKLPDDLTGICFQYGGCACRITGSERKNGNKFWTAINEDNGVEYENLLDDGLRSLIETGQWPLLEPKIFTKPTKEIIEI